jgi:uncharacterized protein YceK
MKISLLLLVALLLSGCSVVQNTAAASITAVPTAIPTAQGKCYKYSAVESSKGFRVGVMASNTTKAYQWVFVIDSTTIIVDNPQISVAELDGKSVCGVRVMDSIALYPIGGVYGRVWVGVIQ